MDIKEIRKAKAEMDEEKAIGLEKQAAEHVTDVVVVGSGGGGLCGAVTAAAGGLETLLIEKEPLLGGSTALSGGVLWLPNNPLMQAEGVPDSLEEGLTYLDALIGDVGPASSHARRVAYITEGENMVRFLQSLGVPFLRCEGYSDYYADMAGIPGGKARGRSIEPAVLDGRELGLWQAKLRLGQAATIGVVVMVKESPYLQLIKLSPKAKWVAAKIALRTLAGRLKGENRLSIGTAMIGWMLKAAVERKVSIWTDTGLTDLIVEGGRVVGVVANQNGRTVRIRARHAVLLSSGGFSRNAEMRQRYSKQPNAAAWTVASPGDTGEVIEVAMQHGAAVDLMDEAWWVPISVKPDGEPVSLNAERHKPGSIIVDRTGRRYFNEAISYMEAGQQMYAHNQDGGAIPSWLIMDSRFRSRYMFAFSLTTPKEWLTSGFMKKADTLEELARACGIDAAGLKETVERFNSFARTGRDPDFHRGDGAHARYQGDYFTKEPNPCLGPLDRPPFYAVELYPGDFGTSGGLLCDEFARVLDAERNPIPGLYAAGNCTASVMGRAYPGAGASIGASFIFAYIGMRHAMKYAGIGKRN